MRSRSCCRTCLKNNRHLLEGSALTTHCREEGEELREESGEGREERGEKRVEKGKKRGERGKRRERITLPGRTRAGFSQTLKEGLQ